MANKKLKETKKHLNGSMLLVNVVAHSENTLLIFCWQKYNLRQNFAM
jgi:hypothetical protein